MSGIAYIYGQDNDQKTGNWDPRISVQARPNMVQIGVVPPSSELATDGQGMWVEEDGQFLSLDRQGLSRLIKALQAAGLETFGRDPW